MSTKTESQIEQIFDRIETLLKDNFIVTPEILSKTETCILYRIISPNYKLDDDARELCETITRELSEVSHMKTFQEFSLLMVNYDPHDACIELKTDYNPQLVQEICEQRYFDDF